MKKSMLSTKQSYLMCAVGIVVLFGILMGVCESGMASTYIKGIMMTSCIAIIMTTSLNLTIGVLGQPFAGLAAAVTTAVGLAGQFLDEGVFLLLIGFFRLIRNVLIPAIFSQGLPHGSHDLRKLRVTLVLSGR